MGAAVVLLSASTASAGNVEKREARQRHRIHDGVDSGALTHGETRRLAREQVRIKRAERRLRANDGHLGLAERVRLNHRQNHASRHIYRAKHNGRTQ